MVSGSRRSTAVAGAVAISLFVTVQTARAAELSYGMDAGVGFTDNVARVAEDEQSETIASIGGQLRLDHESKRLTADIATRLEYRDYLDDTFDSEVVGNLIAHGVLDIIEERFTWTLEDTFGQTTLNQFAPVTPDNSENANYLSTGPDFMLPLGSRNQLVMHGRYVDVHYEDSEFGNDRIRGEIALERDLSDASTASLNATTERVSFDDPTEFADFDNNEAFLSYELDAARTNLSIDGGVAEIRSNGETNDTWLGRVNLTRRASPALTVGLELGHDFSDAGAAFEEMQSLQPGSLDPVVAQQTATPFENTYGTVFARFSRNRTSLHVRVGVYDESYDSQPQYNRERLTFDFNLDRSLNAALTARIGANYSREDYEQLGDKFADLSATLGILWSFGRATSLSVDYRFLDRSSDTNGGDYSANEVWVRLAYLVGEGAAGGGFGGP